MSSLTTQFKTITPAVTVMLVFATIATAQIPGLCNTGQTAKTVLGCTGVLVTPNPTGGGSTRDGNWLLAYPYPVTLSETTGPCELKSFVRAWVDTPNPAWISNDASSASEWITPFDGETNGTAGWYVYLTTFHVPSRLTGGGVPTGLTINGRLTSDNATYALFMGSPADGGSCAVVKGLPAPINPNGPTQLTQWWDFSFTKSIALTPDSDLLLYFLVQNYPITTANPTGFRAEFFSTSTFN
jgi:hypothetical protein